MLTERIVLSNLVTICAASFGKSRHVLTNIIVMLVNCSLLFAQFRHYFVPSAMEYVPLGAKSSYNISFTNSLVLNKDKITISIKDS